VAVQSGLVFLLWLPNYFTFCYYITWQWNVEWSLSTCPWHCDQWMLSMPIHHVTQSAMPGQFLISHPSMYHVVLNFLHFYSYIWSNKYGASFCTTSLSIDCHPIELLQVLLPFHCNITFKLIPKLIWKQPPSASLSSPKCGYQGCTIIAFRWISKLAQSLPSRASLSSLHHSLQVHL